MRHFVGQNGVTSVWKGGMEMYFLMAEYIATFTKSVCDTKEERRMAIG